MTKLTKKLLLSVVAVLAVAFFAFGVAACQKIDDDSTSDSSSSSPAIVDSSSTGSDDSSSTGDDDPVDDVVLNLDSTIVLTLDGWGYVAVRLGDNVTVGSHFLFVDGAPAGSDIRYALGSSDNFDDAEFNSLMELAGFFAYITVDEDTKYIAFDCMSVETLTLTISLGQPSAGGDDEIEYYLDTPIKAGDEFDLAGEGIYTGQNGASVWNNAAYLKLDESVTAGVYSVVFDKNSALLHDATVYVDGSDAQYDILASTDWYTTIYIGEDAEYIYISVCDYGAPIDVHVLFVEGEYDANVVFNGQVTLNNGSDTTVPVDLYTGSYSISLLGAGAATYVDSVSVTVNYSSGDPAVLSFAIGDTHTIVIPNGVTADSVVLSAAFNELLEADTAEVTLVIRQNEESSAGTYMLRVALAWTNENDILRPDRIDNIKITVYDSTEAVVYTYTNPSLITENENPWYTYFDIVKLPAATYTVYLEANLDEAYYFGSVYETIDLGSDDNIVYFSVIPVPTVMEMYINFSWDIDDVPESVDVAVALYDIDDVDLQGEPSIMWSYGVTEGEAETGTYWKAEFYDVPYGNYRMAVYIFLGNGTRFKTVEEVRGARRIYSNLTIDLEHIGGAEESDPKPKEATPGLIFDGIIEVSGTPTTLALKGLEEGKKYKIVISGDNVTSTSVFNLNVGSNTLSVLNSSNNWTAEVPMSPRGTYSIADPNGTSDVIKFVHVTITLVE